MSEVTVRTLISNPLANPQGTLQRNVTLWLNPDRTVSLLGNLPHGTTVIVDQKLVDDLQALVNTINKTATSRP